jgi:hypothetical protein
MRSKNNITNVILGRVGFMGRVNGGGWQVTKKIKGE